MTISIDIKGVKELNKRLSEIAKDNLDIVAKHLYQEAEGIMAQSKQIVPVDTGALKNSGHVQLPKRTANGVEVVMGYGGPAAKYALYVHEDLQASHPGGGQAKYLELPFKQAAKGMGKRLANRIAKESKK